MGDGYWNRQPPLYPSAGMPKRQRPDYGFGELIEGWKVQQGVRTPIPCEHFPPSGPPAGHDMLNYFPRDEDRGGSHLVKDTKTIGSAYDRYLQSSQLSYGSGESSNFSSGARLERGVGSGMHGLLSVEPSRMSGHAAVGSDLVPNGRGLGFGSQLPVDARPGREVLPLPADASNTIFVEGLPPDSTRREVAHIFRPFLGYKEVRLVSKESKHRGGDPLVLCFVDFINPACAATALSALQGYKMDEHESDSHILRMQFARYPGPRSGSGGSRSGSGSRSKR